jgi:hypothetical protein
MEKVKDSHLKIKICVSGASETGHCGVDSLDKAQALGRHIVQSGAVLVTGATTGFPFWAAKGAKEVGGISIGISPATSKDEHVKKFKLPIEHMDLIIYTGGGYSNRNLQLTRSSDAVIVGCGRMGTLNEFTIAFEDNKPIGILEGDWETDEVIKNMIEKSNRGTDDIIFDPDPKALVEKIIALIKANKKVER